MKLNRKILRKIILEAIEDEFAPLPRAGLDAQSSREARRDREFEERFPDLARSQRDMELDIALDRAEALGVAPEPLTYENFTEQTLTQHLAHADMDDLRRLADNELADVADGLRVIKRGARGKDVELIQVLLRKFLFTQMDDEELNRLMGTSGPGGIGADGIFGGGTESAVAKAQKIAQDSDMPYVQIDGQVGKQTLDLLLHDTPVTFEDPTPYIPAPDIDSEDLIAQTTEEPPEMASSDKISSAMAMGETQYLKYPGREIYKVIYPDGRIIYGEYNEFILNPDGSQEEINAIVPVANTSYLQGINLDTVSDGMWQNVDVTYANFSRFPE